MKLRIGALLATVALLVAIFAYLREWQGAPPADGTATHPAVPAKASPVQPAVALDGGAKSPVAAQDGGKQIPAPPPLAPADLPATSTTVAPRPASPGTGTPAVGQMPRPVAVASGNQRARVSPGDPLATDEDRKAGAIEVDKVTLMLRDYRTRMGSNPVGTNAEIMKAVMGDNPKGARLGPPEGQALNGNSELIDRWGTPYFFHQLSATSMEIRSAGPDREMYTEDDLVK